MRDTIGCRLLSEARPGENWSKFGWILGWTDRPLPVCIPSHRRCRRDDFVNVLQLEFKEVWPPSACCSPVVRLQCELRIIQWVYKCKLALWRISFSFTCVCYYRCFPIVPQSTWLCINTSMFHSQYVSVYYRNLVCISGALFFFFFAHMLFQE